MKVALVRISTSIINITPIAIIGVIIHDSVAAAIGADHDALAADVAADVIIRCVHNAIRNTVIHCIDYMCTIDSITIRVLNIFPLINSYYEYVHAYDYSCCW